MLYDVSESDVDVFDASQPLRNVPLHCARLAVQYVSTRHAEAKPRAVKLGQQLNQLEKRAKTCTDRLCLARVQNHLDQAYNRFLRSVNATIQGQLNKLLRFCLNRASSSHH